MSHKIDWTELAPIVPILRAKGLSVSQLSDQLGVNTTTFYKWRKENNVILAKIPKGRKVVGEVRNIQPWAGYREKRAQKQSV
jgi:lambda repressor-like predicted transcriptional regulator